MSAKSAQLLAKLAPILEKLRPNLVLSEWAKGTSGQEDADELVEWFDAVLSRDLLLDYWDTYLCLIHYSASLNPGSEIDDFTAFLVGIGTLESDVNDEDQAQHALEIGQQQVMKFNR
ncbi:MAG: hypothetical protein Q7K26_01315 [bacterium]|nr:hypothetical protein [bacterium]